MNFKELREANLSKAQIKKVHDKADDLPKNDFIKRYGKDGDAVRFATATNIVKKQLGVEDYEEGFKSDAQRKAAFASGYKEKGKNKKEELDDKDKETIKPIIKQLQKSVKAHGKQAKQLQKDIKDEVEEGDVATEGGPGSGPQKGGKKQTFKNDAERQAAVASLYSKLGLKGASKRSREKDKGKKKEEVELDEVHFSNRGEPPAPKGMHKLRSGRDIPSSSKVDKIHKKVVAMTDRNDHSGARIEIAKEVGDKQLVQIFSTLQLMHDKYSGAVGNQAIELRNKFEPVLNKAIDRKFGKYADVIQDAL